MRRFQMISLVLFLGALAGCGWGETLGVGVSGAVTYKGQPINGATLLLYPTTAGQGAEVSIPVTQEGTFRTADVPLGDYKIVVQNSAPIPDVPPCFYTNLSLSFSHVHTMPKELNTRMVIIGEIQLVSETNFRMPESNGNWILYHKVFEPTEAKCPVSST